jgi:hypothetical protein
LLAAGGTATTTAVLDWVYVRRRLHRRWFPNGGDYAHVRRRLDEIADRVGRAPSIGKPIVWRLRNSDGE